MTGWAQQIVARNIRARDGINHLRASRARTSGSSYFIIFVQNFRFIYRMVSTQRPPVIIWKTLINDESWFEWNVLCDDSAEWGYSDGEILGTQPCRGGRRVLCNMPHYGRWIQPIFQIFSKYSECQLWSSELGNCSQYQYHIPRRNVNVTKCVQLFLEAGGQ